jgi:hypothetical protein
VEAPPSGSALPQLARRQSEINLAGLALKLGMADRPSRAIIETVRKLVDRHGFPPPKTPRFRAGKRLTGGQAVHAGSIWWRDPVEQWFDDDLPPGQAALCAVARATATRADLANRARRIAGAVA